MIAVEQTRYATVKKRYRTGDGSPVCEMEDASGTPHCLFNGGARPASVGDVVEIRFYQRANGWEWRIVRVVERAAEREAMELRAQASLALVESDHRQFVQTANMAAGRELFRAHGYSSVELYQTMRERADVKVMKALGGVR